MSILSQTVVNPASNHFEPLVKFKRVNRKYMKFEGSTYSDFINRSIELFDKLEALDLCDTEVWSGWLKQFINFENKDVYAYIMNPQDNESVWVNVRRGNMSDPVKILDIFEAEIYAKDSIARKVINKLFEKGNFIFI